jgi:hypothetical protein
MTESVHQASDHAALVEWAPRINPQQPTTQRDTAPVTGLSLNIATGRGSSRPRRGSTAQRLQPGRMVRCCARYPVPDGVGSSAAAASAAMVASTNSAPVTIEVFAARSRWRRPWDGNVTAKLLGGGECVDNEDR